MTTIQKRYDFVLLFDVQDGNPNGDPDAGNLPRMDPETQHGLVTDVCLKRKVRNYVLTAKGTEPGYDIFIKERAILNQAIEAAVRKVSPDSPARAEEAPALAPEPGKKGAKPQKAKASDKRSEGDVSDRARVQMCADYFDVRTFGAVMSTGANAGQVRGPVQMTFARSVDRIYSQEHSITRMAVATEEEAAKQKGDNRTMGRKNTVPYGLYRAHGFVSPAMAEQKEKPADGTRAPVSQGTGFSEADLELFWSALVDMFDHDRSAARGLMATRALIIFEHSSRLGDARAHELFDRVRIARRDPTSPLPARAFADYVVTLDGKEVSGTRVLIPAKAG